MNGPEKADRRLLEGEARQLLQRALDRLPDKQRTVYVLGRLEGYSHLEIADQTRISALTVKTQMSRPMLNVRNCLQQKRFSGGYSLPTQSAPR
jgi:RNA polymerase sigma-70 factor (ECF subfamily)